MAAIAPHKSGAISEGYGLLFTWDLAIDANPNSSCFHSASIPFVSKPQSLEIFLRKFSPFA
ncbi:hypothetical protein COCNU_13G001990 [Cocos nucifera]|uniref:Uncharacterized protein n=1 Tax=Cocos nucifera TaxID=13894 RepID=A0A8K0ISJ0_COCNU|nr:hypothetical protein COCNU_13G001990 [Cocos nucifera]